ncbi:MAG: T9SS type A sorting domain-containing protein [candidate division Zixibacteria bacterium]|nr:T9SS type A sorting domain-containing protein [candidate division Zixibacteria bacterium]
MKTIVIALIILLITGAVHTEPLGDTVGTTYWTYQNNGSVSSRIAVGDDGSIYVCWMNVLGLPYPPAPRCVYYNWRNPDGVWNPNQFDSAVGCNGAGFCNLDIIYGNRGAIIYHSTGGSNPTYVTLSVECEFPGMVFFNHYNPPDEIFPQTPDYPGRCYWPDVAVDRNDNIHIVMTENTDWRLKRLCYTNSTDGGSNWSDVQLVDSVMVISAIITASPVSDRVAIAFLHPNDTTSQYGNEVYYIVSEDGLNWNWQTDNIQVTDYMNSDSSHIAAFGVEALFDYNDVLHIAWPTSYNAISWLWHYDELSENINLITVNEDTLKSFYGYIPAISQVSLSRQDEPPVLFATWCQYAKGDTNTNGEYNGDLYINQSGDNGLTWQEPQNITNTPLYESEICPSAAEDADLLPYITYIYDSCNSRSYAALPVMFVEAEHLTGIKPGKHPHPEKFTLSQNYPNPFNVKTTVQYALPIASNVNIEIYDMLGRKIETLFTGRQPAGSHSIIWDADKYPSAIYFYKIKANNFEQARKMVLLK